MPIPRLLEELGQQQLADVMSLLAAGLWMLVMTGSAFHKAMAHNTVQLMQVLGSKGLVAGRPV